MGWALLAIIIFLLVGIIREHNKLREDPEKWAEFNDRIKREVAEDNEREYRAANERIPQSKWYRMTKNEKADVFERRERAEDNLKK